MQSGEHNLKYSHPSMSLHSMLSHLLRKNLAIWLLFYPPYRVPIYTLHHRIACKILLSFPVQFVHFLLDPIDSLDALHHLLLHSLNSVKYLYLYQLNTTKHFISDILPLDQFLFQNDYRRDGTSYETDITVYCNTFLSSFSQHCI